MSVRLSRAKFEELNLKLFQKTLGPIKTVLEDADLKKDQVRAQRSGFLESPLLFLSRSSALKESEKTKGKPCILAGEKTRCTTFVI